MPGLYPHIPKTRPLIQQACPFYDSAWGLCRASTACLAPGPGQRLKYCASDDYDNCPFYLCKALRSSAPKGLDRDTLVDSGK
jgi:hypothetical protein